MTHDTDCTVLDEYRDKVTEMGVLFSNGQDEKAREMAREFGWDLKGSGVGRIVFKVSGEQQRPEAVDAAPEEPCVVKFDLGKSQNRDEVQQFQNFPNEMVTAGPDEAPVVAPVKDWHPDYLWLSMPEVKTAGSREEKQQRLEEVKSRLDEHDWVCDDMHSDNVGEMHDEAVIIDYGVECRAAGMAKEGAHQVADHLRQQSRIGDMEVSESDSPEDPRWEIWYHIPEWVLDGGRPSIRSVISVNRDGNVGRFKFRFGSYDALSVHDGVGEKTVKKGAVDVLKEVSKEWESADVAYELNEFRGEISVELTVEPAFRDHRGWFPMTAVVLVLDVFDIINEEMPGGSAYPLPSEGASSTQADVESEIEAAVEDEVGD